ncbi:MAG TPA: hypothetical protein VI874_04720 [Candidatus Norongarragalinales archaeon]|nr:hypothetical protein [Candidatus Norongarragalinales archaeon]
MGVAEELADLWRDVPDKPAPGTENEYFTRLLRLTLESKKRVEETGRRYATLPTLRDLIRKRIVRVPAQHVPWLEVSGFDLVANPLKKSLQGFVSQFTSDDVPLVDWFVHAAKKDAYLALDVQALDAWLKTQKPVTAAGPADASLKDPLPSKTSDLSVSAQKESANNSELQNHAAAPMDTRADPDPLPPDRVFESS